MATESAGGAALEGLRRIVRAVAWLLRASLIAAAALMLACIAIQVVMRYVFGRTPSWSEEVAILMFAWTTLGGLALGDARRLPCPADRWLLDALPPRRARPGRSAAST